MQNKNIEIERKKWKELVGYFNDKGNRWEGTSTGEYVNEDQEIGKRRRGMGKENPKTSKKTQKGRDWWNGLKKMDGKYWMATNKGTKKENGPI
jgi:hypothetical protein